MNEVAATLELSLLTAESLHGSDRLQVESAWAIEWQKRQVEIDTTSASGRTLAIVFPGYCRREFGAAEIRVERIHVTPVAKEAQ